MLKRLFIISFFTGLGQAFSVWVLKTVARESSLEQTTGLAQADANLQLLLNIIALGLQSAAIRSIAVTENWQPIYRQTQSARLTLGLILLPLVFIDLGNPASLVFLIVPLLSLSGDYALYATGRPIAGSIVAFLRGVIPYSIIILAVYFEPGAVVWAFIAGLFLSYLLTDMYISKLLGVPFFVRPDLRSLYLYLRSLLLGVVGISLYFIGLGLLLIIPYFYKEEVTVAFVALKFYLIFKGVLRIIHQAFVKEMLNDITCLRVDELSMIGSVAFLGSVVIFPDSFISFFFGSQFLADREFFYLLAISAVVYSFVLSMTTRFLLEKIDKSYTLV
ncbi:MAG: hypothetical protein H7Y27_11140, partial [Gemmatimonadaceae bacterium]|nr:hypothetical protein [Chitinophagaceae bacterium]